MPEILESTDPVSQERLKEALIKIRALMEAQSIESRSYTETQLAAGRAAIGDVIDDRVNKLVGDIALINATVERHSTKVERLSDLSIAQQEAIDNINSRDRQMRGEIEQLTNRLTTANNRLNGTIEYGGGEAMPIEQVRTNVSSIKDQLSGASGGVSLTVMVEKFCEVSTLVNFGKALGLGTVGTLATVLFGLQQPKQISAEDVKMLETVKTQAREIDRLAVEIRDIKARIYK
jgi:hypothetical protein